MRRFSVAVVAVVAIMATACHSSENKSSPDIVAGPKQFSSGDEALETLKANTNTPEGSMGGRCGTLPHGLSDHREGSTGELTCTAVHVGAAPGRWLLNLWTYSDDFYAEAAYRKSCALISTYDGWWVIWEPGQNWYAEVSEDTDLNGRMPPAFVAEAFANALSSAAWRDCSAIH
jgi:hypothetical protein